MSDFILADIRQKRRGRKAQKRPDDVPSDWKYCGRCKTWQALHKFGKSYGICKACQRLVSSVKTMNNFWH